MLQICNNSQSLIPFQWDQVTTAEHILLVEPSCGELPAFTELRCELSVSASCPGNIDEDIACHLGHVDETVCLHVSAIVKNRELVIEDAEIDFGVIRFGESATRTLTLRNPGRSPVEWSIQLSPSVTSEVPAEQFKFCPSSGVMWPLDMCTVEVTLCPEQCQSLDTLLEVVSGDCEKAVIGATAIVLRPQVCLLGSSFHKVAYLDATTSFDAVLFNQTALSTTFEWGDVICLEPANIDFDVSVDPKSGVIEARGKLTVTVHVTPHTVDPRVSLIVPCRVAEMDEPINLSVITDVYQLNVGVVYSVSADKESWLTGDGLLIDFGGNNLLDDMPKMYLRIENISTVATHFRLAMESFPSAVKVKQSKEETDCASGPARLLKRTANLTDPTAKTGAKAVKELRIKVLKGGAGVAFHLNPSSGDLPPFSVVVIEITAFADLWGFYSDRLQCYIGDLDVFIIPVLMSVVDSPILFQMVSHDPSLTPIMRFGCVVEGTKPVTRRTRILNRSPVNIRIDWQTFNVSADDLQLVDLIVIYGDPFPLKDKKGKEIILPCDSGENLTEDTYKKLQVDEEAIAELAESRPQLISLNMREHYGKEATAPYSIEPSQLVRTAPCIMIISYTVVVFL